MLPAFPHRIANRVGRLGRVNLMLFWRSGAKEERIVTECKVRRRESLAIFDQSAKRGWDEKSCRRTKTGMGKTIEVWDV